MKLQHPHQSSLEKLLHINTSVTYITTAEYF